MTRAITSSREMSGSGSTQMSNGHFLFGVPVIRQLVEVLVFSSQDALKERTVTNDTYAMLDTKRNDLSVLVDLFQIASSPLIR